MMTAVFVAGNGKVKTSPKISLVITDFSMTKYGEKNKSGINTDIGSKKHGQAKYKDIIEILWTWELCNVW